MFGVNVELPTYYRGQIFFFEKISESDCSKTVSFGPQKSFESVKA